MTDIPTPQNDSDINVSALEEELNRTISATNTESFPEIKEVEQEAKTLSDKIHKLEHMEQVIEGKSHELESDIKTKLINLKSIKQTIETELQKIKGFETTKDKIEEEIQKIKKLESDQLEVDSEIKSIEEQAKNLGL